MKKTAVFLLGLVGAMAFTGTANAASVVTPDLDGDGKADTVVNKYSSDNPDEQVLLATIRGRLMYAHMPVDSPAGLQPLRVADINGDGKKEVIVTEIVGVNTNHLSVWGYTDGQMRTVTLTDPKKQLRLFEGGGISAINDFGCETVAGTRRLVTVSASLDWDTGLYRGERVTFTVRNGVATEVSRTSAIGPRDSVVFQVNQATCA